ncbi:cyclase [Labedaea rhizosphaerae]|uniref:Dehydratase n=1 Tax=Labedaea rhizosphaerae TaxID=598644 RepID=A0A4R6SGS7_LABRH|nr:cyclase [Labedaea rhizosphaerae]TDQ00833.1 dehydratase [Labedaea rhizosphaerae]
MSFALLKTGLAAVAATALTLVAAPNALAATDINYACQADTPLGPQAASLTQTVDATAPATVAPGGALDVVVDPAPSTVPSDVSGFTVKNVNTFTLKVPVPANSTLTGVDLTGGTNLGGTPTWTQDGSLVVVTFPGPIAGGSAFELPTITAHLTAGASGVIESGLYGTSFDDPGLTFTTVASTILGNISAPTSCYPDPNPVLTSTTIG